MIKIVAALSLFVVFGLSALIVSLRSDVSALESDITALRRTTPKGPALDALSPSHALSETRVREVALKMEPALTRVAELEIEVRELRKSIDRIGQALGDLAGMSDGPGGRGDGSDPLALLASDDPKAKEAMKKAVGAAMRGQRDSRLGRWIERLNSMDVDVIGQVAKERHWPTTKTEEANAAVKDFRADYRKALREAMRSSDGPLVAQKRLDSVVEGARDKLVRLLGASEYESYRTAYNKNAEALSRLRSHSTPVLPPAK